jgi:hypothetical protein
VIAEKTPSVARECNMQCSFGRKGSFVPPATRDLCMPTAYACFCSYAILKHSFLRLPNHSESVQYSIMSVSDAMKVRMLMFSLSCFLWAKFLEVCQCNFESSCVCYLCMNIVILNSSSVQV